MGSSFDISYVYYSAPYYSPYEIRGLLIDGLGSQCISNEQDGVCSLSPDSFTTSCPAPGVHHFNVTCTGADEGYTELCYLNDASPMGCDVNCTVSRFKNVTLVYNVTTSADTVTACTVDSQIWYNGSKTGLRHDYGEPYHLDCLTDDVWARGGDSLPTDCTDYNIRKNQLNNITLLNLSVPMQYWWNIKCHTVSGGIGEISDLGDYNYTFILR